MKRYVVELREYHTHLPPHTHTTNTQWKFVCPEVHCFSKVVLSSQSVRTASRTRS